MYAETIEHRYERLGGFTSGFDYARLFLSIAVLTLHGYVLCQPEVRDFIWHSWFRPLPAIILPAFFALSGFLVTGSLQRQDALIPFVTLRAIRLMPALAVEVLLSAFLLGPMVTSMALGQYFTDSLFFRYLLNIAGHISFYLPGVFLGPENFSKPGIVNLSLWTIPFELKCYISLVGLSILGVTRRRILFLGVTVVLVVAGTWRHFGEHSIDGDAVGGSALVVAFLIGSCLALFKDIALLRLDFFVISTIAAFVLLQIYSLEFVAMIPCAYMIVYLGMQNPTRYWIVSSGDYSYGIYLFAFPIQQTYFYLFPNNPYFVPSLIFSLIAAFAYAYFSWHFIERPILSRKKNIVKLVQGFADALQRRIKGRLRKSMN